MTDELENFFSPERLHKKWVKKQRTGKQNLKADGSAFSNGCEILYEKTRQSIIERFSKQDHGVILALMDDLKVQLDLRFAFQDGQVFDDEEFFGTNRAIDELLAQIEDIVEALEMQGGRK